MSEYKTTKVTITATDKFGRKESITMLLNEGTAQRLTEAASQTILEIAYLLDDYRHGYRDEISRSQYNRLLKFHNVTLCKFHIFTLKLRATKN